MPEMLIPLRKIAPGCNFSPSQIYGYFSRWLLYVIIHHDKNWPKLSLTVYSGLVFLVVTHPFH